MSSKHEMVAAGAPRELADADLSGVAGGVDAFCGAPSPNPGPFPPCFPHRKHGPFPPKWPKLPHFPKRHGPIVVPL
jgi:hypothetical protein